jgi:hypothetical protein
VEQYLKYWVWRWPHETGQKFAITGTGMLTQHNKTNLLAGTVAGWSRGMSSLFKFTLY